MTRKKNYNFFKTIYVINIFFLLIFYQYIFSLIYNNIVTIHSIICIISFGLTFCLSFHLSYSSFFHFFIFFSFYFHNIQCHSHRLYIYIFNSYRFFILNFGIKILYKCYCSHINMFLILLFLFFCSSIACHQGA